MVAFLVIVTILAFIGMDALIQLVRARRELEIPINVRYPVSAFTLENVSLPAGIFLDSGHTWIEVDPSGRARVGADDFVQRAVGRVDEIELPTVGGEVRQGETLFAIRQGNRKVELPAPLDGVVAAVN